MRQQRISRTDIRRARRSRERRRGLRSGDAPLVRTGGAGPDLDEDLLQRITRIIEETSAAGSAPTA